MRSEAWRKPPSARPRESGGGNERRKETPRWSAERRASRVMGRKAPRKRLACRVISAFTRVFGARWRASRVFRRAPECLSALRPPSFSGERSNDANPGRKMRRGKEEVCVLEIVRPGMEESESAEKQENTGIGPASACRGESAFTRVFHALCARPTGAAAPERLSALRPPSIRGWRSKGANHGCRHAPRERWGVCVADDVARGSRKCGRGYCALAPCGRGRLDVATCENG
jgi:hypothetical protein